MFNGDFYWWFGVVEERDDSNAEDGLKLGRIKVRIMGLHSPTRTANNTDGEGIPTSMLHWAYPMMPVSSASMNGIGDSPTGMVEGTNVFGFSRDGNKFQDHVIVGTFGGVHTEIPKFVTDGFCDPNGKYPKKQFLNEPDTNRLARNEKITETIVQKKKDTQEKGVPIASGGTWDEPANPYNATYPYNHVRETESGHIIELDDTAGNERIHTYHKSGTFTETDKEGTQVEKIVKDKYSITLGSDYISVHGSCHIHVGGDATVNVVGNVNLKTGKNFTADIGGNVSWNVSGTYTINSGGDYSVTAPRINLN